MKRIGVLSVGAALIAAVGTFAACSDDEQVDPGSSSGDGGSIQSDATTSSSSSTSGSIPDTCTTAAPVDPNCNYAKCSETLGKKAICVAGACQALVTDDCVDANIFGKYDDDRAVWLGGATALKAAGGLINPSGPPRRNSMQLAVDEINAQNGIPDPSGNPLCNRPLAAIVCDDGGGTNTSGTTDVTDRVGKHLVQDLGIHAILGGGTSGPTIALATNTAVPGDALVIAPSATAIAITALEANSATGQRLMWRTAPSDLLQSSALIKLYDAYVAAHPGTQKLAIVDKGDAYGKGLADEFQKTVNLNGGPVADGDAGTANFYRGTCSAGVALGDGGVSLCNDQVEALLTLQPTIIVLAGTAEQVTQVLVPYEDQNNGVKPFYFVPDGPAKQELFDAAKTHPTLAARIQGTVPGAETTLSTAFFPRYKTAFPTTPDKDGNPTPSALLFGMAGTYDATYLLTYAAMAANNGGQGLTGSQYAQGLAKMISGTAVDVGVANFPVAVASLTGGQGIDFNGASGPLNFDIAHGEAPSDMIVWCLRKDPNTGNYLRYDATGIKYDSVAGDLVGTYLCPAD